MRLYETHMTRRLGILQTNPFKDVPLDNISNIKIWFLRFDEDVSHVWEHVSFFNTNKWSGLTCIKAGCRGHSANSSWTRAAKSARTGFTLTTSWMFESWYISKGFLSLKPFWYSISCCGIRIYSLWAWGRYAIFMMQLSNLDHFLLLVCRYFPKI